MSHVFRYIQASSVSVSTVTKTKPTTAVAKVAVKDCGCNYDNNYYGDQVCDSQRK